MLNDEGVAWVGVKAGVVTGEAEDTVAGTVPVSQVEPVMVRVGTGVLWLGGGVWVLLVGVAQGVRVDGAPVGVGRLGGAVGAPGVMVAPEGQTVVLVSTAVVMTCWVRLCGQLGIAAAQLVTV